MTHLSEETINEYLDQALAPRLQAETEAHLADCRDCAARLAELRSLFASIDTLADLPLEMDFAPAIIAHLKRNTALPRQIRWLTIVQTLGTLLAAFLAWPLAETRLPSLVLPSINETLTGLATSWLATIAGWRLPSVTFELPSLQPSLPTTTLAIASISVFLLWLAVNGLLLIPRSRRTP